MAGEGKGTNAKAVAAKALISYRKSLKEKGIKLNEIVKPEVTHKSMVSKQVSNARLRAKRDSTEQSGERLMTEPDPILLNKSIAGISGGSETQTVFRDNYLNTETDLL